MDTHAWIWAVLGDAKLGRRARAVLTSVPAGDRVGLASISLKEASWQLARGRIVVSGSWEDWLRRAAAAPQVDVLPLTVDVAIESERLSPSFPPDPADRIIAATARVHGLTLLTVDHAIRSSKDVATLW
jgi:PIN domain nuclease of toxin-antitoxin system